ncbi:MAG: polysaccharide biosynthesis protein, partial [Paludibacteraceae bacterium]
MQSENANRRIAKNTIYLYIRTIVVMFVSLYTSRLVLQVLGETDLGIYNVVGGIVTLLAFLQTAQSKATSRYITYELGENASSKRLGHVFSAC